MLAPRPLTQKWKQSAEVESPKCWNAVGTTSSTNFPHFVEAD